MFSLQDVTLKFSHARWKCSDDLMLSLKNQLKPFHLFLFYFNLKGKNVSLLLLLSHSVVSDSLRPHGLLHARPPCPTPSPRACSNSCPWVGDAIQPSHPLSSPLLPPSRFPSIRVFANESALHVRWPKYWSLSFRMSPSSEYSGLISFRMDCFDCLAIHSFSSIASLSIEITNKFTFMSLFKPDLLILALFIEPGGLHGLFLLAKW